MAEPDEGHWPLPLVVLATVLAVPVVVADFNWHRTYWARETAAHPSTWLTRLVLHLLVGAPGYFSIKWIARHDKGTDPMWKRVLHIAAIFGVGCLVVSALFAIDRSFQ
jgi:hypothetical protein